MKRPLSSFFPSSWSIVAAIILHCLESFETGFWAHYNSTNSTGVGGLVILNVHLACGSGVMTDEVMEMIVLEPDVRDGYWNLTKKKKRKFSVSPEACHASHISFLSVQTLPRLSCLTFFCCTPQISFGRPDLLDLPVPHARVILSSSTSNNVTDVLLLLSMKT